MKKYLALFAAISLLGAGCSSPSIPTLTKVDGESSCDGILTLSAAKSMTGAGYIKREATAQSLGKIIVTTCTFTGVSTKEVKPLSILTRQATTEKEASTIFEQSKTASYTDGQTIADIGEQALWSPTFNQVSVLKGKTWLIVTANGQKELATNVARNITPKLP